MKRLSLIPAFVLGLGLLASCLSSKFDGPEKVGGVWVDAKVLNLGYDTYQQYCMQCHGQSGEGNGPASYGMNPQPRNFKQGIYKFGSVSSGELPTDEDLKHTIRYGLKGTPMLPWDISDERLNAVIQYIKTFSPAWRTGTAGTPQTVTADPYGAGKEAEAIALGKKVYHGMAQCYTCHPSYASLSEIREATKEMTGNNVDSIREKAEFSLLQDSSYGHKFMPPDYTKSAIKTGGDVPSLYKVIGTGVGGTTMPAWKNALSSTGDEAESEKRLWAVAYYVNSLYKLRYDEPARKKFFDELNTARSNGAK